MPNIFKNEAQRKHWNEYNNKYSKENYKTISLKLNKRTDKDIIEYLETSHESPSELIRKLIRDEIKRTGK